LAAIVVLSSYLGEEVYVPRIGSPYLSSTFFPRIFSYRFCFLWVIFDPILPYLLLLSYGFFVVIHILQPISVLLRRLSSSLSVSQLSYSVEKSPMSFVSNPPFVSLLIALLCIIPLIICITCPVMTVISRCPSVTVNHS